MQQQRDRVSVVMPAFNAAATITEAIHSVLTQTYQNLELVVCDDASTDNTVAIVRSFADERIRLLQNTSNQGEGITRDRAIANASGNWIAVLDADDAWYPERLARLVAAANGDPQIMVFDDILECFHTKRGLVPWRRMRGNHAFGSQSSEIDVNAADWARSKRLLIKPLIPTTALKNLQVYHTARRYAEDTEFFMKLVAGGMKLRYVPEPYYLYRKTPGSASALQSRHIHMQHVLEDAIALFDDAPDVKVALRQRLTYERHLEIYFQFLRAARSRHIIKAAEFALSHPAIFLELITRTMRELPYHLRRYRIVREDS